MINTFSLPLLNTLNIAQPYEYRNADVAFQLHIQFAEYPELTILPTRWNRGENSLVQRKGRKAMCIVHLRLEKGVLATDQEAEQATDKSERKAHSSKVVQEVSDNLKVRFSRSPVQQYQTRNEIYFCAYQLSKTPPLQGRSVSSVTLSSCRIPPVAARFFLLDSSDMKSPKRCSMPFVRRDPVVFISHVMAHGRIGRGRLKKWSAFGRWWSWWTGPAN